MSTISLSLILNILGMSVSLLGITKSLSLDYKNYRYKTLSMYMAGFLAHVTIAVAATQQTGLLVATTIMFGLITIIFFIRPSIGAIPEGFKRQLKTGLILAILSILSS